MTAPHQVERETMQTAMLTYPEVWPLGADETGVWLLSGESGPWPGDYISSKNDPSTLAELELIRNSINIGRTLLHSTSWRIHYDADSDQNFGIFTFMAVVPIDNLVLDRWPDAISVPPEYFEQLGRAPRHGPAELPEVPWPFVLEHGLRHLRFLRDTDADVRVHLSDLWCQHLETFAPAIARMYQ